MSTSRAFLAISLALACASAHASILNLWWEPATQNALVGQTVSIDVYANASGPTPLALSDAYLAITWDPAVLTNATPANTVEPAPWVTSYWAPGAPANTDLQDGDAQRELLGQLPPDFPIAPVGVMRDPINKIKVTSFSFTVNALAPPTSVKLWGNTGVATTNFYKGNFEIGQWDLNFEQGAYSEAFINPVPEPATMAVLSLGVLGFLRKSRTRG